MKWFTALLSLVFVSGAFAQPYEIVLTKADVEISFDGGVTWINGGDFCIVEECDDTAQTIFSVDSISYSPEPLSTDITHTTKLNEPETWESAMWRLSDEPFRKAVFVITIYEAANRRFELRVRNRYIGEEPRDLWSLPTEDKVIGKPEKPINVR